MWNFGWKWKLSCRLWGPLSPKVGKQSISGKSQQNFWETHRKGGLQADQRIPIFSRRFSLNTTSVDLDFEGPFPQKCRKQSISETNNRIYEKTHGWDLKNMSLVQAKPTTTTGPVSALPKSIRKQSIPEKASSISKQKLIETLVDETYKNVPRQICKIHFSAVVCWLLARGGERRGPWRHPEERPTAKNSWKTLDGKRSAWK